MAIPPGEDSVKAINREIDSYLVSETGNKGDALAVLLRAYQHAPDAPLKPLVLDVLAERMAR